MNESKSRIHKIDTKKSELKTGRHHREWYRPLKTNSLPIMVP